MSQKATLDDFTVTLLAALRGCAFGMGGDWTEGVEAIRRVCETARVAIETEAEKPRSIW